MRASRFLAAAALLLVARASDAAEVCGVLRAGIVTG
jgi:hypothetical protein